MIVQPWSNVYDAILMVLDHGDVCSTTADVASQVLKIGGSNYRLTEKEIKKVVTDMRRAGIITSRDSHLYLNRDEFIRRLRPEPVVQETELDSIPF